MNLKKTIDRPRTIAAILTIALIGAFTTSVHAAAMVTAEEAAEGWISLFDGETLFGWNQIGDTTWRVEDGVLLCDTGTGGSLVTSAQFADFELKVKLRVKAERSAGIALRAPLGGNAAEEGAAVTNILAPKGGGGDWNEITMRADGKNVSVTIDGADAPAETTDRAYGYVAIQYHTRHNRADNKVEVAEIKLRPLNLTPLFNGEDLSGWNIIPGRKSKFAVIDGAISIKDGNGQIETAGVYKDFTLQLDIISNGTQLNSGVFYRGPVGVFWKGYESQVRNHWNGDDRTSPVDFGTGGNYGNQPARKVVSTDHEWFRKTIVCVGNHTAVWINGFLASDYTDTRPISPNQDGKSGYVPGPGTIHLQGHDPTTDLAFKNIGIRAY